MNFSLSGSEHFTPLPPGRDRGRVCQIGRPPLFLHLFLGKVHQIEHFCCSGKSGIEPTEIVGSQHVIRHIPLIQKDPFPLSTLRLVTSDGIGILQLQSVEINIFFQLLHPITFQRDIRIVLHHGIIQTFTLLAGQCRRL